MSRHDQFIGLPTVATCYLNDNKAPTQPEPIGMYYGMFDQTYPLYRYTLNNGLTADEFLQASPWNSGPMFFLGLRVSDGTLFQWGESDIRQAEA